MPPSGPHGSSVAWPPAGPQPPKGMATLVAQAIVHCAMWTSFHGRELEETIREKKNDQSLWAFLFNLDSQDRPDVQYYNARLQFEQLLATSRFALKMTDVARGTTGSQHAAFNKHRETNVRVASPQRSRTDRLVSPSRTQHKQQRRLHADYGPRADTHASVAKRRGLDRRCGRNEPAPTTATRAKYSQRQLGSPARRDAVARALEQLNVLHGRAAMTRVLSPTRDRSPASTPESRAKAAAQRKDERARRRQKMKQQRERDKRRQRRHKREQRASAETATDICSHPADSNSFALPSKGSATTSNNSKSRLCHWCNVHVQNPETECDSMQFRTPEGTQVDLCPRCAAGYAALVERAAADCLGDSGLSSSGSPSSTAIIPPPPSPAPEIKLTLSPAPSTTMPEHHPASQSFLAGIGIGSSDEEAEAPAQEPEPSLSPETVQSNSASHATGQRSISDRLFDIWDKKRSQFEQGFEDAIETVDAESDPEATRETNSRNAANHASAGLPFAAVL